LRVIQNRNGVIGTVSVVVVNHDFRIQVGSLESWSKTLLDEHGLVLGKHQETWVVARVQGLVLYCNGVDSDSLLRHALYIFHEVRSIGIIKLRLQAPPF